MNDGLLTFGDLEARWRPPGQTPMARRKWLLRRISSWRLPLLSGRGESARFRPVDVLKAEARAAGERSAR